MSWLEIWNHLSWAGIVGISCATFIYLAIIGWIVAFIRATC